jgi:ABC-type transport system involved in multi-copper enzyme maturation permease subunit
MRRRRITLGLPLLMRELSDQASRGRHYVLRTVLATVLMVLGYVFLTGLLNEGNDRGAVGSLGNGPRLFDRIVYLEWFGILLFLPALTCGAIAAEKERNTLSILLTTRLGPITIVLEKLLSRLVVVFSLLLLSLPLLAFAYSLGGLSLDHMFRSIFWLMGISVMVATLSLMCSAWCGSSVSAFFMTYSAAIALYIGIFGFFLHSEVVVFLMAGVVPNLRVLLWTVLLPSVIFFWVTVHCLVRRASVAPRNFVLSFFRGLDRLFVRMNVVTGNITLTRETATLPDTAPIAWRETAKKSLGTVRYLVRVLVAIELPTVFLLLLVAEARATFWWGTSVGGVLWVIDWCIAAALIAVMSGSLVSRERTQQTLPVLLATPIPGDEIIRELFAGVRRLVFVLWIPFATIAGFEYWFHMFARIWLTGEWLLCAVLELTIYPFLIAWVTFYLGVKIRSPLWAIMSSLSAVAVAVIVPYLLLWIIFPSSFVPYWYRNEPPPLLLCASPGAIIVANEYGRASYSMICLNFAIYGGLLFVVRRHCLRHADHLLGRADGQTTKRLLESAAPIVEEKQMAPA